MATTRARPRATAVIACVLLTAAACGPDLPPIPTDEPFTDLVEDLSFGMFAAALTDVRPDTYLSDDGTRTEDRFDREVRYLLTPREPERPAPPTARLAGIETRQEYWDTLKLRTEWSRLIRHYSDITGTSPECSEVSDLRSTWTRAVFDGPVVRRLTTEVYRGPDGQSFESFLVARVGVGAFEEAAGEQRTWDETSCPDGEGVER